VEWLVFRYWVERMGKSASHTLFTDERVVKVRERLLQGYTVDVLRKAIDGCALSPHHQGKNGTQTVYDDLELICRDGAHVERFVDIANRSPGKRAASAPRDVGTLSRYRQALGGAGG
jgi:hypothetical protein